MCNNLPVYIVEQDSHLYLDDQTIRDLNLISKNREDSYLFKQMNFTKTIFGETTLRFWLLHPLNNLETIKERQNMIIEISDNTNLDVLTKLHTFYQGNEIDITKLRSFLNLSLKLLKSLEHTSLKFNKPVEDYEKMIANLNILEGDYLTKGTSCDYDNLSEIYEQLPFRLNKVATNLAFRHSVKLSVLYFPHVGYLIESSKKELDNFKLRKIIEEDKESEVDTLCASSDAFSTSKCRSRSFVSSTLISSRFSSDSQNKTSSFTFFKDKFESLLSQSYKRKKMDSSVLQERSNTSSLRQSSKMPKEGFSSYSFVLKDSVFIKNQLMNRLDEDLGDVFNMMEEIKKREILNRTQSLDLIKINELTSFIWKIDALFSLSQFKKKFNCTKPHLFYNKKGYETGGWSLKIKNYFHQNILIDINKNLIFRGSQNTLRIIGQISVISQIGSFVPCASVTIPLVDKLFTSLDVKESIGNSFFLSSIRRIRTILQFSNDKTMILIDSFGYGTNAEEAYKIFLSVHKNIKYPIVLSLTQFNSLFYKLNNLQEKSTLKELLEKYTIRFEKKEDNVTQLREDFHNEFNEFERRLNENNFPQCFIKEVKNLFKELENSQ